MSDSDEAIMEIVHEIQYLNLEEIKKLEVKIRERKHKLLHRRHLVKRLASYKDPRKV